MAKKAREVLMEATSALFLERGFGGTSVEAICERAELSKGSFFYHFKSKEDATRATLEWFFEASREQLAASGFESKQDPVERLMTYLAGVTRLAAAGTGPQGCLLGALSLELSSTHPEIRTQIDGYFDLWAASLTELIRDALGDRDDQRARSLADHFIATLEGSLLLAGSKQDLSIVESGICHFRDYVAQLIVSERSNTT